MAAGFVNVEVLTRLDVYADAPQASSAAQFGTLGITFRARKARSDEEWLRAADALRCSLPARGAAPA